MNTAKGRSSLMFLTFLIFSLHSNLLCDAKREGNGAPMHQLLLLSLDGFRWDFLNGRASIPNFLSIKKKGIHATSGMTNEFITNTLPNHFTLVTGLHVESHGFVDNMMYDPDLRANFVPKYHDPFSVNHPDWHKTVGEPIWVSNQLQKEEGRSGVIMWMGGEVGIKGVRPTRHIPYNLTMPNRLKIDLLIDWLTHDTEPINLGVVYFPEPDKLQHKVGPDSHLVTEKISELDADIGYLLQRLEAEGLLDSTDIILTSDHGFVSVSPDRVIMLDEIIPPDWYSQSSAMPGPLAFISPKAGKTDAVFAKLQEEAKRTGHFTVYRKEDIPERFRLKKHYRVPAIVATARAGYSFVSNTTLKEFWLRGNHGYDNLLKDMRPFFLAMGPSFKQGFTVDTFPNVDVYPLMCHIMGLRPLPHNGSMEVVSQFLMEETGGKSWNMYVLTVAIFTVLGILISVIYYTQKPVNKPKHN